MQFTPQQLAGGMRYQPRTKIGNWNEDLRLNEALEIEYTEQRMSGGSIVAMRRRRQEFLDRRVTLSKDSDNVVRFGHVIALRHAESHAHLACTVFEETPFVGSEEYLVTAIKSESTARTVFEICLPQRKGEISSSALLYGEVFYIACHKVMYETKEFRDTPLYLKSALKSERSMSIVSSNARVFMSTELDANALWYCERADLSGAEKTLAKGSVIHSGESIALIHKMTGAALYARGNALHMTDLGMEMEVCAYHARMVNKFSCLQKEEMGVRQSDVQKGAHLRENVWSFILNEN